jgi:hypothetical protein
VVASVLNTVNGLMLSLLHVLLICFAFSAAAAPCMPHAAALAELPLQWDNRQQE